MKLIGILSTLFFFYSIVYIIVRYIRII